MLKKNCGIFGHLKHFFSSFRLKSMTNFSIIIYQSLFGGKKVFNKYCLIGFRLEIRRIKGKFCQMNIQNRPVNSWEILFSYRITKKISNRIITV